MEEIVNHLRENRQIESAKSILGSAGYRVTKPLNESYDIIPIMGGDIMSREEALDLSNKILNNLEDYYEGDLAGVEEVERALLNVLEKDKYAVYYSDIGYMPYRVEDIIADSGNEYFGKGYIEVEDEDTGEVISRHYGYFRVSRDGPHSDGVVDFIRSDK